MNDGPMSDGDVIAQHTFQFVGQVEDRIVLNVRVVADDDAVDVPAEHGVKPNAGEIA